MALEKHTKAIQAAAAASTAGVVGYAKAERVAMSASVGAALSASVVAGERRIGSLEHEIASQRAEIASQREWLVAEASRAVPSACRTRRSSRRR